MQYSHALRLPRSGAARKTILVALAAFIAISPEVSAHGHGIVGDRIFISPIVGNDSFPDNAFSLTTRRSDYAFSIVPTLEKQLSESSSLLLTGGWDTTEAAGNSDPSGARDLSIYYRQSLFLSPRHETEFTISPFVVAPTGDRRIGDQGYTHLGGEMMLGKGMGDLPDTPSFRLMRPIAIQAEAGYAGRVQGPANSDVFANLEVEYSLGYLNRYVRPVAAGRPLINLVPYVEFDYSQAMIDSRLTTSPDFLITPGVAYLGDKFLVSLGAQVDLNGASHRGDRAAALCLVEIFYDDIFPALGKNPF